MTITFKVCDIKEEVIDVTSLEDFTTYNLTASEERIAADREIKIQKRLEDYRIQLRKIPWITAPPPPPLPPPPPQHYSLKERKLLNSSLTGHEKSLKRGRWANSFVISVWESYNNHWHLELRPDNVWMAILTQFSFFVNKNSELLRDKLVDFQGKKTLQITVTQPILSTPFDLMSLEFAKLISQNLKDPLIKDWLVPSFTTTTPTDKVCYSIALMATVKKYFNYSGKSQCGIPTVTLHGITDDWIDLKERALKLLDYNLETNEIKIWLQHLIPVLDKFIESSNGTLQNKQWWNEAIDYRRMSGEEYISGWLTAFCFFDNGGGFQYREKNDYLKSKFKDSPYGFIVRSIPLGCVSVPVELIDSDGTVYNSEFHAGQFASKIDKLTNSISPSLGWFIVAD